MAYKVKLYGIEKKEYLIAKQDVKCSISADFDAKVQSLARTAQGSLNWELFKADLEEGKPG